MQGERWIDEVMAPLSPFRGPLQVPRPEGRRPYNRIYEAVSRGTEKQGRDLVQAILDYIEANRETPKND